MSDVEKRNERIFSARCSGRTLKSIGDEHGIGAERVRAIVAKFQSKALLYDGMRDRMQFEIDALRHQLRLVALNDKSSSSVDDLDLTFRTANALKMAEIYTLTQVRAMTDKELLALKNMGRKSLRELRDKVAGHP